MIDIHPEVQAALSGGGAVVALESTIISHGMPHPQNIKTAREVEATVRAHGAVPATVAVLGGRVKVGLTPEELELLATAAVEKISTRDLGHTAALGRHGATTVASTMRLAHLAGIRVFATGGSGGVHRGAETSMDVSADLLELARTPVCVVSAGVKSILDIGLTLEVLETHGVPALTYRSSEFPAFYSRESGFAAPLRVDSPGETARTLQAHWALGGRGALLANPLPEAAAIPSEQIEEHIAQALADMERAGLRGKETTPYLLARVAELTGGESLSTNIALVLSNAELAAQVAVELSALREG